MTLFQADFSLIIKVTFHFFSIILSSDIACSFCSVVQWHKDFQKAKDMHVIFLAREHTENTIISMRYITSGRYENAVVLHYGAFCTKGFLRRI